MIFKRSTAPVGTSVLFFLEISARLNHDIGAPSSVFAEDSPQDEGLLGELAVEHPLFRAAIGEFSFGEARGKKKLLGMVPICHNTS